MIELMVVFSLSVGAVQEIIGCYANVKVFYILRNLHNSSVFLITIKLIFFNLLLDIFITGCRRRRRRLVTILSHFQVADLRWDVVEPCKEEEHDWASFTDQRKEQHVLCHCLIVVKEASTAVVSAAFLPQNARLVNQATEDDWSRYGPKDSNYNPLDA